ncbi:MAG TPA: T9SS type A sorting domain-containing protein [Candidatus Kapabacteria bacterium]|nr:T9SS type A sorting domain-containing protein [Candidatus Kapabacteria bacterium]
MKQRVVNNLFNEFLERESLTLCFIAFFLINLFSASCFCQWRKVLRADPNGNDFICVADVPGCASNLFVGTQNASGVTTGAELWKSTDYGKSWKVVFQLPNNNLRITSICFKDGLVGWLTCEFGDSPCFKTVDGGNNWSPVENQTPAGRGSIVYYHPYTKLLFLGENSVSKVSQNFGINWLGMTSPSINHLTGMAFIDSLHGVAVTHIFENYFYQPFHITIDGGYTWQPLPPMTDSIESFQPVVLHDKIFIAYDSIYSGKRYPYTSGLYVIDTFGNAPKRVFSFSHGLTPCVATDGINIFLQISNGSNFVDVQGFIKSSDEGQSWESICGPHGGAAGVCLRFIYTQTSGLWAEESYESVNNDTDRWLWNNPTGKPNSPRIQFELNNSSRELQLFTGDVADMSFYYPNEKYYEPIDSISLTLQYSKALRFLNETPSSGWAIIRKECTDTSVKIILRHIDLADPSPGSEMLKVSFQTYLSTETSGTVALDEVAFNQDVPQRPCMIDALTNADSLRITFLDRCGDSLIRGLIDGKLSASISSIYPNPANDHISISVNSAIMQDAEVDCVNALGQVCFSQKIVLKQGNSSLPVLVKELPSGLYVLRIRTATQTVTQSFLKD